MLASLVNVSHLVEVSGYPLLFALVAAESAGVPIPGETALITAAVLASGGKLKIELVIPIAAVAAIVGDNIGYQIGRHGGRWPVSYTHLTSCRSSTRAWTSPRGAFPSLSPFVSRTRLRTGITRARSCLLYTSRCV